MGGNLIRLVTVAGAVLAANLLRVVTAIHFDLAGASWELAHDLPDLVIYCSSLAVAVVLTLRADRADADAADAATPELC